MAKVTEYGNPATKAASREWMKRIRENVREIEQALKDDDWSYVEAMANDISGAASEILAIAEAYVYPKEEA